MESRNEGNGEPQQPSLTLLSMEGLTLERILGMFRAMMGREPTPAEIEETRKEWAELEQLLQQAKASPSDPPSSEPNEAGVADAEYTQAHYQRLRAKKQ